MKTIIRGGLVYDGLGNSPRVLDILIEDDRITKMGEHLTDSCEHILPAEGKLVTPGFVDMHRHSDRCPLEDDPTWGEVLLRQGITTTVTGNCGISMYPLSMDAAVLAQMQDYYVPVLGNIRPHEAIQSYEDYLTALKKRPLPVNIGAMIGMGAVAIAVKGFDNRPFTPAEREKAQQTVRRAMELGAPGVSIGLMYLPECFESVEELGEILKPVGEYGRRVTAHIRGEGDSLVKSVEEVIEIGKRAGCTVQISHFKSCGVKNWGKEITKAIKALEDRREELKKQQAKMSADCDFYPYDCGSTTLLSMIPPAFMEGGLPKVIAKLRTEEGKQTLREMLSKEYDDWDNYAVSLGWDKVVISAVNEEKNLKMIGKSIPEIVKEFGYVDDVDAVADLICSENGTAAIIIHSMSAKDIDTIAKLEFSNVISDAIYAKTKYPHPRMYGAFPHFLREYAFERGVIPVEEAIRKMTSLPAERMGLWERGRLRVGCYADINVFDAKAFTDCATYTEPTRMATGLSDCLVNGQFVIKDGILQRTDAGKWVHA